MLVSKPNNTAIGLLIGVFVFVQIAFTFEYYEEIDKNNSVFYPAKFLLVALVNLLVCSLIYFIAVLTRKQIVIDNGNILIMKPYRKPLGKKIADITDITWGSPIGQRSIWLKNIRVMQKTRNDYFTVSFADGYILEVGVKEYSNFDELRGWFLTFGRKSGIIKVRPLEERKRRGSIQRATKGKF